jgi:hypothetical protein
VGFATRNGRTVLSGRPPPTTMVVLNSSSIPHGAWWRRGTMPSVELKGCRGLRQAKTITDTDERFSKPSERPAAAARRL